MPTVPVMKMIVAGEWVNLKDASGKLTKLNLFSLDTLAVALTDAEWLTLKKCIQNPEVWFEV